MKNQIDMVPDRYRYGFRYGYRFLFFNISIWKKIDQHIPSLPVGELVTALGFLLEQEGIPLVRCDALWCLTKPFEKLEDLFIY